MTTPPVMRQPWPIPVARRRNSLTSVQRALRLLPRELDSAERNAEGCLTLFLASAMDPFAPSSQSLDALLYARGALEAASDRSGLGRSAKARLEMRLIRALTGSTRRQARSWRHTIREIATTHEGEAISRRGHAALRAWLRGRVPRDHSAWSLPRPDSGARPDRRRDAACADAGFDRVGSSSREG